MLLYFISSVVAGTNVVVNNDVNDLWFGFVQNLRENYQTCIFNFVRVMYYDVIMCVNGRCFAREYGNTGKW